MVESEIDNANDLHTKYQSQHVAQLICSQRGDQIRYLI